MTFFESKILFVCLFLINGLDSTKTLNEVNPEQKAYKIVCYYTNWSQYRTEPAQYFPDNVDPSLCTHIIFSFAKINEKLELDSFEVPDN